MFSKLKSSISAMAVCKPNTRVGRTMPHIHSCYSHYWTHVHTLTSEHHTTTHTNHIHTHAHTCTHAHTHACTHARMHARTHTYTHTCTLSPSQVNEQFKTCPSPAAIATIKPHPPNPIRCSTRVHTTYGERTYKGYCTSDNKVTIK